MLILLVTNAFAYDVTTACPTVTIPADAAAWDDDRGVKDAISDVTAAAQAWSEAGCEWTNVGDDPVTCTTSAGAEWTFQRSGTSGYEYWVDWSVVLAAGLDSWTEIRYESYSPGYDSGGEATTSVSWTGSLSGLPDDGALQEGITGGGDSYAWSYSYETPGCDWAFGHRYEEGMEMRWTNVDWACFAGQPVVSVGDVLTCEAAGWYLPSAALIDGDLYRGRDRAGLTAGA